MLITNINKAAYHGNLTFFIQLRGELSSIFVDELTRLINAWFVTGMYGAYGGYLHSLSPVVHSKTTVEWRTDMGSSSDHAIEALVDLLNNFNTSFNGRPGFNPIERITIGYNR